jgi:hypothetical protein
VGAAHRNRSRDLAVMGLAGHCFSPRSLFIDLISRHQATPVQTDGSRRILRKMESLMWPTPLRIFDYSFSDRHTMMSSLYSYAG